MRHSRNEEQQGRGIMADRFDLDAIEADDALLDLLAAGGEPAREAGEHDAAVKLLAELRLAVEVGDAPHSFIESTPRLRKFLTRRPRAIQELLPPPPRVKTQEPPTTVDDGKTGDDKANPPTDTTQQPTSQPTDQPTQPTQPTETTQ